jgi:hypothetical protein
MNAPEVGGFCPIKAVGPISHKSGSDLGKRKLDIKKVKDLEGKSTSVSM